MPKDKNDLRAAGTEDLIQELDKMFQSDPGLKKQFDQKMNEIIINYFVKNMEKSGTRGEESEIEEEIEMLKAAMFKSLKQISKT